MNSDRRDFLKKVSLLSATAVTLPTLNVEAKTSSRFNMSGYRAPKLDKVRVAIVGLGNRGSGAVDRYTYIEGAEIVALCDRHESRALKQQEMVAGRGLTKPAIYSGDNGWKQMLNDIQIDLLYICTPWDWHTPMSIAGMKAGAHVACEVPIGLSVKDCWEVVKVSEQTKKHCMMLENCCYDFFEMLTLKMAREGVFGEIIHAEGAYIHDLLDLNFSKTYYDDFWRLKENIRFNGNLYPTHGIGPVAQCMNINRGDVMTSLVAMQTDDFHMGVEARRLAETDDVYKQFVGKKYRGNMNTTLIRTQKGKTIMIQHDVTSPRPYSRIHLLSGTKGFAEKYPKQGISLKSYKHGHSFLTDDMVDELRQKYTPELVRFIGEEAKKVGGHGGMDFMMDWRLIDCLRNGLPLDQDVYDAAAWSAIVPLSVESVAKNSKTVNFPDFTKGAWTTNIPVDLTLNGGGNTKIRPKVDNKGKQLNV